MLTVVLSSLCCLMGSLVAVWRTSEKRYFRSMFVLAVFSGLMASFSLL
jgi:hypothetical protein